MDEQLAMAGDVTALRARVAEAGLDLDERRLKALEESLQGIRAMIASMERVEIDPLDLALEPFDPTWPDVERGR